MSQDFPHNRPIFRHDASNVSSLRDLTHASLAAYQHELDEKMFATIDAGRDFEAGMNVHNLIEVLREIERRAIWRRIEDRAYQLRLLAERAQLLSATSA